MALTSSSDAGEILNPGVRAVGELLRRRAERSPDEAFVKCAGEWLTTSELDARSDRLAVGLAAIGVERGDRVACISPNRIELVELLFAVAKLGAVSVMLNCFLKGEFLRYQLADSGARVLVVDSEGYRRAAPLLAGTDVEHLIVLDEPHDPTTAAGLEQVGYRELAASTGATVTTAIDAHDPLSIIYTSGTTGMPKGCILSHGYYTAAGLMLGSVGLALPGDRIITASPLFHASGQTISLMLALTHEASVCFEREFSASQFMARAGQEGATVAFGVGPMGMAILAQPESATDREHHLRLAIWPPMPPARQDEFQERFAVPVFAEAYGQTECQPITLSVVDGPRSRASNGRPMPHLDVRIVDDHDRELAAGAVGEIVVRPREPDVMFSGYWRKPEATVETFRNLWHHTGDFGRIDPDGFLTFVDRKKDCIRRRGENVSSFELESAIARHPSVLRAAVVPVPSPLGEDDIKACIVPHPGAELTVANVFDFFKAELPYFAIPRYVQVRAELPMTDATDRVMKHVLRDEGAQGVTWDLEALGLRIAKDERR